MIVLSFFFFFYFLKSNWTYMREKSVVAYQISELQNFSKFLSLLTRLPNKYLTHFDLSCQAHKITRDQKHLIFRYKLLANVKLVWRSQNQKQNLGSTYQKEKPIVLRLNSSAFIAIDKLYVSKNIVNRLKKNQINRGMNFPLAETSQKNKFVVYYHWKNMSCDYW